MSRRTIIARSIALFKLCLASRKEDALKKYPHLKSKIDYFIQHDPSGNLKYLDWEIKILQSGQAMEDEIVDVVKLFDRFGRNLPKKDIYQYQVSDFTKLRDDLFQITPKNQKHDKTVQVNEEEIACGTQDVYSKNNIVVKLIANKAASVHYGQGTRWCIRLQDRGYYENYAMNNVVFFFIFNRNIPNLNPLHKIAVAFLRDSDNVIKEINYYDANDKIISVSDVVQSTSSDIIPILTPIAQNFPKSILAKISSGEANHKEISLALADKEMRSSQDTFSRVVDKICKNYENNLTTEIIDQMVSSPSGVDGVTYQLLDSQKNISSTALKKMIQHMKKNKSGQMNYHQLRQLFSQNNILPEDIEDIYNSFRIYDGALEEFAIEMQTPGSVLVKIFNTINTPEFKDNKDVSYKINGVLQNILNHPNCPSELIDNYLDQSGKDVKQIASFGGYGEGDLIEEANDEMKLSNKEYVSYSKFLSSLGFYQTPLKRNGLIDSVKLKPFRIHFTALYQALSPRLQDRFMRKDKEILKKGYGSSAENIEVLEDTSRLFS